MKRTTIQHTKHRIELNAQAIIELLRKSGVVLPKRAEVAVRFHVPGGGDYSNMTVEVSTDAPVTVEWETREEREEPTT